MVITNVKEAKRTSHHLLDSVLILHFVANIFSTEVFLVVFVVIRICIQKRNKSPQEPLRFDAEVPKLANLFILKGKWSDENFIFMRKDQIILVLDAVLLYV